jgi:Subtilisin-like serine proteases
MKNTQMRLQTPQQWQSAHSSRTAPLQVVIQFAQLPTTEQKAQLSQAGIELLEYIFGKGYTAIINEAANAGMLASLGATGLADVQPGWKADRFLWEAAAIANTAQIDVVATFRKNVAHDKIRNKTQQIDPAAICYMLSAGNIFKISIAADKLIELASWPEVLYISPRSEDVPLNLESRAATRSYTASLSQLHGGYGLTGKGVMVGVGDNMSGATHIDLKDHIINYNAQPYTNHGVHINGIVGGAGIVDPRGEGTAPGATLIDHFFSNVIDQAPAMVNAHNMTITNNSYAAVVGNCGYAGTYDATSVQIDQLAIDYPTLLNVFAAGNDGYLDCNPFPAGYATVNGAYQPAKNNIVVTSTDKNLVNAVDGGRGPVKDGRLKPEIAAVGVDVRSTTRKDEYLVAGGTSMACPGVAGALALVTERYRQINGNVNPANDLLKVLILNGAIDIGNPGPDYRFGFGFMNTYRTLQILDNGRFAQGIVDNGGQQTHTINVPNSTVRLKVMITWNDVPASPMSAKQLVNDLDMVLSTPSSNTHYPLVLDPLPANILNDAIEREDHLNNTEQIVVDNPVAGTYTVTVKGYAVPSGSQAYAIAYDFVPQGVVLGYPTTGAQVKAADSLRIYWDAPDNAGTFLLEYSTDGGANYTHIASNIPADQRHYTWFVPANINSADCRMRVSRNGGADMSTNGNFAINTQPVIVLDPVQCPGYIATRWKSIPNAAGYELLRKVGPYMQVVATTTDTSYVFNGLSEDTLYYVAVRPVFATMPGYRSLAIKRQPNTGTCAGSISDGDMHLVGIKSPASGRQNTSSQLGSNMTLSVQVRNVDDEPTNFYRFSYSINGSPWQSRVSNFPIDALGTVDMDITGVDMSVAGTYEVRAAITNLLMPDPVSANDSFVRVYRHLKNDPMTLPFADDFEQMGELTTSVDSMGFTPNEHWDYKNANDSGRLRSYINPSLTIQGNRSISMDATQSVMYSNNSMVGTFNLAAYDPAGEELRVEYDYRIHGVPDSLQGNEVWVRGSDTAKWVSVYRVNPQFSTLGNIINSGSLSISDALLKNKQSLTSSFQVRFGQNDTTLIGGLNYGAGITFDNVKLYTVVNDVQLIAVLDPVGTACGLTSATPISVKIYNGVNQQLDNITIHYRMDGGNVVSETIASLRAKEVRNFTFQQRANLAVPGKHVVDIWLSAIGDSYKKNDSIMNYSFINQPLITIFPYKQDFENGEAGWFSDGLNNSWQFGTPASSKVTGAASGTNAWKTNLTGTYNSEEQSHLYTPCFDINGMLNPTLRFKKIIDVENCGEMILCDAAYVEYSFDGSNWMKLGRGHQGINWYNDTAYKIWTIEGRFAWEETITQLPKDTAGGNLRMRFSIFTDASANFEGIAIDDVEVFDNLLYPKVELVSIYPNPVSDGRIYIDWTGNNTSRMNIVITDISGREVYRTSLQANENYNRSIIETPKFYSGVYLMNIELGERRYIHKVVYH